MTMTGSEIRESFLRFFEGKGHTRVASSSLIPKDDPTLLFTNAGMVQFKNCFLGLEDRGYRRAVSSQKSVRAGGKHNDLENVGVTARHHTFFEMLGNFSFGDYFKNEAIAWAWEYLTEVVSLPRENLWITIYQDDDEAFAIWRGKMGVPAERIVRMDEKSNFWMMGDTGPCGPCSEILYDQGPAAGCGRATCGPACDCDRYLELWNLVFTQFNRDAAGTLTPLPRPNIDTGMGLERIAAVLQGKTSNYETDLFRDLLRAMETLSGKAYGAGGDSDISLRVIADHSRAVTFLIADGVLPSNEGRGYVLRRILRRAARHGKLLGLDRPFLHEMVPVVAGLMRDAYPDLEEKTAFVRKVVHNEEQRFSETLDQGLRILQDEVAALKETGRHVIPGEVVFRLYDTFGFPTDLTQDIVRRDGFLLDMDGFDRAMQAQREKARESWKGSGEAAVSTVYQKLAVEGLRTTFAGYEGVVTAASRVLALLRNDRPVEALEEGERGEVLVAETPFYGETGGQVGDTGEIRGAGFLFEVWDTQRPLDEVIAHIGKLKQGRLAVGDPVQLFVDEDVRRATEANHSGTHLLQASLRAVLGSHVKQSGSLVNAERLRFDFTHFSKMEEAEMERIEALANRFIRANLPVVTNVLPREAALQSGATAVFDERYGDTVRLVAMGDVSRELCGGTHVRRTGDIGLLKVIHESAVAAGVRRIEAVTGREALAYVQKMGRTLERAAGLLRTAPFELGDRIEKLLRQTKEREREMEILQGKLASRESAEILAKVRTVKGVSVLAAVVAAPDAKALREYGDKLRDRLSSGVILLGSEGEGKALLLCLVTKDLAGRYHAGRLIRTIAPLVGGSGGGRADMAQAGGPHPERLREALDALEGLL